MSRSALCTLLIGLSACSLHSPGASSSQASTDEKFKVVPSVQELQALLVHPDAPPEMLQHLSWEWDGLMQGPCALPPEVSKEQLLVDLLAGIHALPDESWEALHADLVSFGVRSWTVAYYNIGKYTVIDASYAVMERYEAQYPGWQGGIWCFDVEPFGEALAETWSRLQP